MFLLALIKLNKHFATNGHTLLLWSLRAHPSWKELVLFNYINNGIEVLNQCACSKCALEKKKKIEESRFREGLISQRPGRQCCSQDNRKQTLLPKSIPKQLRSILFFTEHALAAVLIHTKHFICVTGSIELGYWRERYLFKAT